MNQTIKLTLVASVLSVSLNSQTNQRLLNYAGDHSLNSKNQIEYVRLKESYPVYGINVEAFMNSSVYNNGVKISKLKSESDPLGFIHTRYRLAYNGIPVHNSMVLTHVKDGKLVSFNGDLQEVSKPVNSISLNEKNALVFALQKVNAKHYKWENKKEESLLRSAYNNPEFSFYPEGELIIYPKDEKGNITNHYAYKFAIYADEPLYGANVIVDAQSGKILAEENLIHDFDDPATANTRFSGTKSFTVDAQVTGTYRLREAGRGGGIETYDMNTATTTSASSDYTNTSTSWSSTTIDQVGTDAHWGAEMVYDYFLSAHSRNSINGAGMKMISFADYGVGYANAFWNGFYMTYGSGSNGGFTGLDICGHEVTHGVTGTSAGLVYSYESGALNESYSDIFGCCVEFFAKPTAFNWNVGEDVGIIRSMSNPNAKGQPDTYLGTNWYTGSGDNGGVHTNSGVSNYWFYLLCQGGIGSNDNLMSYTVSPIGMTNAAKVAYRALTVYYTSNTNYASARNLSIQAAVDLFGACSNEVFQVKSAWHAVGVGPAPSGTATPIANFSSIGNSPCVIPNTVNFLNSTYGGDTYVWDFGDGSPLSTSANPVHTYSANGSYNVQLIATSSCAATPDTLIKNAFVIVNSPAASTATGGVRCSIGTVNLNASGAGQQYWYASSSATGTPLYVGPNFTTPNIATSTTYYVVNTFTNPPVFGGPATTSIGAGLYFPSYMPYDSLTVMQPCKLKTVMVDASAAGTRTIELRDKLNNVVTSTVVNIPLGVSTVTLDFDLTPGYGYRLGLATGSLGKLYRNSTGVSYPYTIGSMISITGSSQGSGYFFFFYNWEVEPASCTGAPTPVTASVSAGPNVNINVSSQLVCVNDSLIALNGTPSGGVFSGLGVSGNSFNPAVGQGAYNVYYTYTDVDNCSNTDSVLMVVGLCAGINELDNSGVFALYPNPANEHFTINTSTDQGYTLKIMDATGKLVSMKQLSGRTNTITIDALAKGIYFIEIQDNSSGIHRRKIIKQ
jgi:Zn-dependent metalloprotease